MTTPNSIRQRSWIMSMVHKSIWCSITSRWFRHRDSGILFSTDFRGQRPPRGYFVRRVKSPWDGNVSWVCVSDNTLELSDIETMVANNPMDLNAGTTIGGLDVVTASMTQTPFSFLFQNDGNRSIWFGLGWVVLLNRYRHRYGSNQAGVLAYVMGRLSLATGTQVNGSDVVTVDTFVVTCLWLTWRCRYTDWPGRCARFMMVNHQSRGRLKSSI